MLATIRPVAKLGKLEALLSGAAPAEEDVPLIADLLSLRASERHPVPNLSPQRRKERTLAALIRQFKRLLTEHCQQPPVSLGMDCSERRDR